MLLKLDFVTNSSSTSYVVFVPNDFTFDVNKLGEVTENFYNFDIEEVNNELLGECQVIFNNIKQNGGILYQDDWNGIEEKIVAHYLINCLPENNILRFFETASEQGYVIAIDKQKIRDLLEKDI